MDRLWEHLYTWLASYLVGLILYSIFSNEDELLFRLKFLGVHRRRLGIFLDD